MTESRRKSADVPLHGFRHNDHARCWEIYWDGTGEPYEIDDCRIDTPLKLLSWIAHLGAKSWCGINADRLARFVEAVASHNGWALYDA